MKVFTFIYILILLKFSNCSLLLVNETNSVHFNNKRSSKLSSSTLWTDPYDDENGVWSKLLIDYTLQSKTDRMSRMEGPHRYIPTSDFYITRRIDEMELDPHIRSPNPAQTLQNNGGNHFQNYGNLPSNLQQQQQQQGNLPPMNRQIFPPLNQRLREVSETDLYLLGAIEKLVYRVDYLENRIRRSEQLIYYLMAGNNEHKKELLADPCPKNFTHIGDKCYHIAGDRQLNWKSANSLCKSMSSHLAEFISITENEEIVAYLLNHPGHRAKDFWLGGLNPGLLWIWSNSAKPVNPNTDLSTFTKNVTNTLNEENTKKSDNSENKILNNITEIKGNGRCLRLSYNPAKHKYFYYGQECTSRHNFICEFEDRTLDNKIKKIGRSLNLF